MTEFVRKTACQINSMQELYDAIRAWLLRPDASMCKIKTGCVYLRDDGNRCAIGALMPDGDVGENCDGDMQLLYSQYENSAVIKMINRLGIDSLELCIRMQDIHDDDDSWNTASENPVFIGIDELNYCAEQFGLKYT